MHDVISEMFVNSVIDFLFHSLVWYEPASPAIKDFGQQLSATWWHRQLENRAAFDSVHVGICQSISAALKLMPASYWKRKKLLFWWIYINSLHKVTRRAGMMDGAAADPFEPTHSFIHSFRSKWMPATHFKKRKMNFPRTYHECSLLLFS